MHLNGILTMMLMEYTEYKTVITCRRVVLENQSQCVWENRVGFGKLSPSQNAHLVNEQFHMSLLCSRKKTGFCAVLSSRDSNVISTKG